MSRHVEIDPAKLDLIFEPLNRMDRPGVVVGVAHQGRPLYRKGFGTASVELPVALSPSMRLRIGSTTKHFCCLALMLLAEDGLLSPEDSVRRHVPELADWAEGVTLAALMSHTAGVRCSLDLLTTTAAIMRRPLPHKAQVDVLTRLSSVNFQPGEDWMYSNGGYVLLTEVVRRVSGLSFESFLGSRILEPAGMFDSLGRPTDTDLLPNSATLHVPNASGGWDRGIFGPDIGGEGNIVSTVDDMLRWLKHMSAPTVGSRETWRRMTTPTALADGRDTGYGFGLAMNTYRGAATLSHGGSVIGGNCQMLKVVEEDLDIVLLSNVNMDVASLTEKIIDACLDGLDPKEDEPPFFPFPTGAFYSRASGRLVTLLEKDGAIAMDFGSQSMPLARRPGEKLWLRVNLADGATLAAADDDAIVFTEFGRPDRLERVEAPGRADASIAGRWLSDEIAGVAVIDPSDAPHMTVTTPHGSVDYALEPVAPDVWRLTNASVGWGVSLEREGEELLFSSSRSRRLRFRRAAA